jgi:hypothetical protein
LGEFTIESKYIAINQAQANLQSETQLLAKEGTARNPGTGYCG